jgi:hypothetical protein
METVDGGVEIEGERHAGPVRPGSATAAVDFHRGPQAPCACIRSAAPAPSRLLRSAPPRAPGRAVDEAGPTRRDGCTRGWWCGANPRNSAPGRGSSLFTEGDWTYWPAPAECAGGLTHRHHHAVSAARIRPAACLATASASPLCPWTLSTTTASAP